MKRQPLILCLALLIIVGAALWGVNYRLDHPPLSQVDKEFRAALAGADNAEINQYNARPVKGQKSVVTTCVLDAAQTRELLIEHIRLGKPQKGISITPTVFLRIIFKRGEKQLASIQVNQTARQTEVLVPKNFWTSASAQRSFFTVRSWGKTLNLTVLTVHQLHPRSEKRLNRALDAYLPQRVRP